MIFSSSSSSDAAVSAIRSVVGAGLDVGRDAASGTRDGADAGLDEYCRDNDAASGTRDAADIGLVCIGRDAASGTREAAEGGLLESVDRSTSASASRDSDTTLSGVDAMVGTLEAGDDDILMVSSAISILSGSDGAASRESFSCLAQTR
jgi:hypothetical protein